MAAVLKPSRRSILFGVAVAVALLTIGLVVPKLRFSNGVAISVLVRFTTLLAASIAISIRAKRERGATRISFHFMAAALTIGWTSSIMTGVIFIHEGHFALGQLINLYNFLYVPAAIVALLLLPRQKFADRA